VVVVVEQKKHGFEHSSLPNGRAETDIQSAKHSQGENSQFSRSTLHPAQKELPALKSE
jgi:hypothetical protein